MCADLQIVPTQTTTYWLNKLNFIFKKNNEGFDIGFNTERKEAIAYLIEQNPELKLSFLVYSQDNYFYNFTNIATEKISDFVFHASNLKAQADGTGFRLHQENELTTRDLYVPQENFLEIIAETEKNVKIYGEKDNLILEKKLQPVAKHCLNLSHLEAGLYRYQIDKGKKEDFFYLENINRKPVALIDIFLDAPKSGILEENKLVFREYSLNFGNRATFWKYFIVPKYSNGSKHFSIETDEQVRFDKSQAVRLPNGEQGFLIESKESLFLKQITDYNFQLKKHQSENADGRIVLKRMPVPSVLQIKPDRQAGKVYSEIIVYI